MTNTSNFTTEEPENCSPFASDQYIAVAILSSCTGAVSAVASLFVIIGILISKKHLFFIQRLILYMSIAVFLNSLSVVLRVQRVAALGGRRHDSLHPLCVFTSFVDQTTSWSALIAICCITCSLLLNVLLLRSVEMLEKVYVALIFVVPLSFNWIPFIKESYGEAGAWCWIRSEDKNCNTLQFAHTLQFVLWYVPLYVVLVVLFVVYIFIVCRVRRLRRHWDGKFDPSIKANRKKMFKEFRPLIWYPFIYLVLVILPTINRIHGAFSSEPSLTLWVLHALFSPLRGGFIALAYSLDGQTVRRMWVSSIVCLPFRQRGTTHNVTEYPATRGRSDSYNVGGTKGNRNSSNGVLDSEPTDLKTQYIDLSVVGSGNEDQDTLKRSIDNSSVKKTTNL